MGYLPYRPHVGAWLQNPQELDDDVHIAVSGCRANIENLILRLRPRWKKCRATINLALASDAESITCWEPPGPKELCGGNGIAWDFINELFPSGWSSRIDAARNSFIASPDQAHARNWCCHIEVDLELALSLVLEALHRLSKQNETAKESDLGRNAVARYSEAEQKLDDDFATLCRERGWQDRRKISEDELDELSAQEFRLEKNKRDLQQSIFGIYEDTETAAGLWHKIVHVSIPSIALLRTEPFQDEVDDVWNEARQLLLDIAPEAPKFKRKEHASGELKRIAMLLAEMDRSRDAESPPDCRGLKVRQVVGQLHAASPPPVSPYAWPSELAADKWIYEKISLMSHPDLSVEYEFEREQRNFSSAITSRNAFKNRANRYAEFHRLPKRSFADRLATHVTDTSDR